MAFIDKSDPVVINIKLTTKGRKLLSEGNLKFSKFAIGDSEIDYSFNNKTGFDAFNSSILKPKDKNPELLSFITKDLSGDTHNDLGTVVSNTNVITNTAKEFGFFNVESGNTSILNDQTHVKQPDAMVKIDTVTGGKILELYKAPTYQAIVSEPIIGDYVLVRWTNPNSVSTTGFTTSNKNPHLFYRIEDIVSGTLSNDDLIVVVDRELPNFDGNGSSIVAGAMIYPNSLELEGISYSPDFLTDATLSFFNNYENPNPEIPYWNMSIIFTEEILGVGLNNKNISNYDTKQYAGFVSYIQNQKPDYKKMGVIHYTNESPENVYGEGFYDGTDLEKLPILDIPTIMWHMSDGSRLGITLTCGERFEPTTGITSVYYNLVDELSNVVGKVFPGLKIFIIEDQELLFAMSFKSNRSWTLPNFNVGFNTNLNFGCPTCTIETEVTITNPENFGNNGIITIDKIDFNQGTVLVIVENTVTSGIAYYNQFTGVTITTPININVPVGEYDVKIFDLGAADCVNVHPVVIELPESILEIYDLETIETPPPAKNNMIVTLSEFERSIYYDYDNERYVGKSGSRVTLSEPLSAGETITLDTVGLMTINQLPVGGYVDILLNNVRIGGLNASENPPINYLLENIEIGQNDDLVFLQHVEGDSIYSIESYVRLHNLRGSDQGRVYELGIPSGIFIDNNYQGTTTTSTTTTSTTLPLKHVSLEVSDRHSGPNNYMNDWIEGIISHTPMINSGESYDLTLQGSLNAGVIGPSGQPLSIPRIISSVQIWRNGISVVNWHINSALDDQDYQNTTTITNVNSSDLITFRIETTMDDLPTIDTDVIGISEIRITQTDNDTGANFIKTAPLYLSANLQPL